MPIRENPTNKGLRRVIKTPGRSAWKIAEEHGVDMSLIANNLLRSPIERIMRHEHARQAFLMLSTAGRRLNER